MECGINQLEKSLCIFHHELEGEAGGCFVFWNSDQWGEDKSKSNANKLMQST